MASFKKYTASGGASEALSIPSFTSDEIKVRVDGVLKTAATHYNITSYTANGAAQLHYTEGSSKGSVIADRFIVLSGSRVQPPINYNYPGHNGITTGVGQGQIVVGDELHVHSDGTNYIVNAHSNQQNAAAVWSGSGTNGAA